MRLALFLFIALTSLSFTARAEELVFPNLHFYTEENYPSNFVENGEVKGIGPELLALVAEELDEPVPNIHMMPWARGYGSLLKEPGTVLFSTAFTDERDELGFKWAGPIKQTLVVLLAKRDQKIKLLNLEDAKAYQIGSVSNDIGAETLINRGFGKDTIYYATGNQQLTRMLMNGRIDLVAKSYSGIEAALREEGLSPDLFKVVYVLDDSYQYYAFHKDTPDALVKRIQGALDRLKPRHNELLKKYGEKPINLSPSN